MTRIAFRSSSLGFRSASRLVVGAAALAFGFAAGPAAAGTQIVGGVAYSCTNHIQIGPDMSGLLKSFQIEKEYTFAFQDCVKACNQTAGCIAVNVKEMGTHGPTMCQLFSKVTGVTPYPIQTTSTGDASWGTACVRSDSVKWTTKNPNETYQADPNAPHIPGTRPYFEDKHRPGPGAIGTPGGRRP